MTNVYVQIGLDVNDVRVISTAWTADTQSQWVCDEDTIELSKVQGYIGVPDEKGQVHLRFSHEKYEAYLDKLQKEQEEAWRKKDLEESQQALLDSVEILYDESDREGYVKKTFKIGDLVIKETEVKLEDMPENLVMAIKTDTAEV